jgi:uncharacterized membrane protein YcjF (UPF0283 family)
MRRARVVELKVDRDEVHAKPRHSPLRIAMTGFVVALSGALFGVVGKEVLRQDWAGIVGAVAVFIGWLLGMAGILYGWFRMFRNR